MDLPRDVSNVWLLVFVWNYNESKFSLETFRLELETSTCLIGYPVRVKITSRERNVLLATLLIKFRTKPANSLHVTATFESHRTTIELDCALN